MSTHYFDTLLANSQKNKGFKIEFKSVKYFGKPHYRVFINDAGEHIIGNTVLATLYARGGERLVHISGEGAKDIMLTVFLLYQEQEGRKLLDEPK